MLAPRPVSVDCNDARALITTALGRVTATIAGSTRWQVTVLASGVCFLADKSVLLGLALDQPFDSPADVETARALAQSWFDAVLAAN